MLKALIFDFDGLILDTETPLIEAYGDVYAAHGLVFDRALFERQIGHADYTFDPWKPFGKQADLVSLEAERRVHNRERTLRQAVLPGVKELIEAAFAEGLRLGVASNSGHEWVEGHLQRLELHRYFSYFGCKGDTPAPKPEPHIYRHVVNQLGMNPAECVALEDSTTGVRAAKRASLRVVAVPNVSTHAHDYQEADWVVGSMLEVTPTLLRKRFGL